MASRTCVRRTAGSCAVHVIHRALVLVRSGGGGEVVSGGSGSRNRDVLITVAKLVVAER